MPELTLHIGDSPGPSGYRDGDIIHAMNDIQLLGRHSCIITDHRKIKGGFFKPLTSLAYYRLRAFSRFMFERISTKEIRRTNLVNSNVDILSDVPNENGHYIHLEEYIARRKRAGKRPMFGDEATCVWFEGTREITMSRMNTLWTNYIIPQTGLFPADYRRREYSASHLRRYLVIVTNDFSNARRAWLESPGMDETDPENPVFVRRRKRYVDWRNIPDMDGTTIDNVLDRRQRVAIRRDLVRNEATLALEH